MKKQLKKTAVLTAAALSVFGMVIPGASDTAAAAEVTINTADNATHSYAAYQVFEGTMSGGTLTGIAWGSGINGESLLTELKSDSAFVEEGSNIFDSCSTAEQVAEVLSGYADDSDVVKAFAQAAGKNLTEVTSGTYSAATGKITDLDTGYYLIKDASAVSGNGAATSFMLHIVEADASIPLTIEVKSAIPTLEKKVLENSYAGNNDDSAANSGKYTYGDGYNDVADYSIGDAINFRLYGTVAENYGDYSTYYYAFQDSYADGFDLVDKDSDGDFDESDIIVTVDGTVITSGFEVAIDETNHTFSVVFENLKNISAVTEDSYIIVEYQAKLNSDAVIGNNGNENEAYLVYSNNPNQGGDTDSDGDGKPDETGETPKDKVVVLTYQLEVTKIDGDSSEALTGVEFKVKNSDGKYLTAANGYVTGVTDDESLAAVFATDVNGKFSVVGIEDGAYTLIETKPLDGYNKIADKDITITAVTESGQNWTGSTAPLTSITLSDGNSEASGNLTEGSVALTVENHKGAVLPSTGGMGTTILYVVGGVLVLGAGIALIVKKRMKNEEAE